jgi:branched-chain amino acid transport system permease protein
MADRPAARPAVEDPSAPAGARDSSEATPAQGYSVGAQRLAAFCVSGFFAGIAALLYAGHVQFISPGTVSVTQSVEGLLMVILGGIHNFFGPLNNIAAAVVRFGRLGLSLYPEGWHTITGIILILAVLSGHGGIVGRVPARRRIRCGGE